jgi:uncharacterized protein YuzE
MNSEYDPSVDAYYFKNSKVEADHVSVRQISLGLREVYIDVDMNGDIMGVEIF